MSDLKKEIKDQLLEDAKSDYRELGGWGPMKSGEWLWWLVQKSFANYWRNANVEYFQEKYKTADRAKLAAKLASVAARNASLLGSVAGAAVTANEITAIVTGGEGGIGLPTNIALAAATLGGEAILLLRIQLQLVANLGKLYEVPLDPDDPEDILTIIAFALGGSVAETAGKFGMKVGGKLAGRAARGVFKKQVLATLKRLASKIGVKILQKTIVNYTIPVASIGIGAGWNYFSTKAISNIAVKHFKTRVAEFSESDLESDE